MLSFSAFVLESWELGGVYMPFTLRNEEEGEM